MQLFYREANGDYLAVETETADRAGRMALRYEGRASAIEGLPSSVCTTGIWAGYLAKCCETVERADVPDEWIKAIGEFEEGTT